jgi:hypothetical protein
LRAIKEGTLEWKVQLEDIAVRHLRAFDPIFEAYQCLSKLSQEGNTLDEVVKSALFTSTVVHYARPFSGNRGGKITSSRYKITDLRHAKVDLKLHDHILILRKKLVAHQDGELLQARIGHNVIKIHEHDVEVPVQTFAVVSALQGIATMIARYLEHVAACVEAIRMNVEEALTAVNAAEHKYPSVKPAKRQKINLVLNKSIAKGEQFMLPDLADTAVAMTKLPEFPVPSDSYLWRRTMVQLAPEGKYEWTTPEGPAALSVQRARASRSQP